MSNQLRQIQFGGLPLRPWRRCKTRRCGESASSSAQCPRSFAGSSCRGIREGMVKGVERSVSLDVELEGFVGPRVVDPDGDPIRSLVPVQGDVDSVSSAVRKLSAAVRRLLSHDVPFQWPCAVSLQERRTNRARTSRLRCFPSDCATWGRVVRRERPYQ